MMRTINVIASGLAIVFSQAVGCTQEVDPGASSGGVENAHQTSGTLLSRTQLSPTHTVDIYEFAPGELAVNERGSKSEERILNEQMIAGASVADLYDVITKSRPELRKETDLETLKSADVRAKAYQETLVKDQAPETLASAAPNTSSSNWNPDWDQQFKTDYCKLPGAPNPGQVDSGPNGVCLLHWNGDASWAPGGTRYNFFSAVDNYSTTQTMKHYGYTWSCFLWNCSWDTSWDHTIGAWTFELWGWTGGGTRKVRAVGTEYNFGASWRDTNCGYIGAICCGGQGGSCYEGFCGPSGVCLQPAVN